MLKRIFSGQINSITVAALLVALSSLISRFLGIFRDRILAGQFGAGDTLDIYYAAFRIPDLIFNLLVLGALSAGFIPIFTVLLKKNKITETFSSEKHSEAWFLASDVMNILAISIGLLSVVGIFFAPALMKLIVPGFSPEKQKMTSDLARIMFLSPIFLGISSVLGGILQSFRRFFVYSLSPIVYNIGIIIGAIYLTPTMGVYGLAWGVVFGSFLHMIVQVPIVFGLGFRYKPVVDFSNMNVRRIMVMMIPRTMSLAITQFDLLITTTFASMLASGSLSIFNFANNLQSFPIGIFGISFAVAAFPAMSAVAFDRKKLVDNFSNTLRQILFFIIPSTVFLIALRAQIVRVILGYGQFDWNATLLTMSTLSYFCISLFAQALLPLVTRVFYARQNSKTPFYVGIFVTIIDIYLSWLLPKYMGVAGLALSISITSILNLIILWIVLRIEIGWLDEKKIVLSTFKLLIAALAGGAAVQGVKLLIEPYINMTKLWGVLSQGLAAGFSGIIVYLAFCSLLKSEEFLGFWGSVKRRLPWNKIQIDDQGEARGI